MDQTGHVGFSDEQIERAIKQAWMEWGRVWVEAQRTFGAARWLDVLLADLNVDLEGAAYQALVQTMETIGTEHGPLASGHSHACSLSGSACVARMSAVRRA